MVKVLITYKLLLLMSVLQPFLTYPPTPSPSAHYTPFCKPLFCSGLCSSCGSIACSSFWTRREPKYISCGQNKEVRNAPMNENPTETQRREDAFVQHRFSKEGKDRVEGICRNCTRRLLARGRIIKHIFFLFQLFPFEGFLRSIVYIVFLCI